MRMMQGPMISWKEIERIKKLRDSGAPPPAAPEQHGERLTSRELRAIYTMAGAKILLESQDIEPLKKRMTKMRLWWRLRGATKTLHKIFDQVLTSGDAEQARTMWLRAKHMTISVDEDRREDPEGRSTWVHISDLNLLVSVVLDSTCEMCVKDEREAADCPLRRALKSMTTLSSMDVNPGRNGCLFRGLTVMDEIDDGEETTLL